MAKELKSKRRHTGTLLTAATVLLIIGLGAFGGYYFKKYQDLKKNPVSAERAAQEEVDRTIAKVAKLYGSLPADEKPNVATVSDKDKLKDQPFFDKAVNGDVALIYSGAKLAILYRPSSNQIINVSSVTIQATQPRVRIIGEAAARAAAEKTLREKFAADTIISGNGDAKAEYTGITIIDLTGQQAEVAQKLATGLGGQVGLLPAGEEKPADTEILVIAGS